MPPKPRPVLTRLLEHVRPGPGGCLLWQGARRLNGYGVMADGRHRKSQGLVHRVAYEHMVGPIPAGMHIDHLCRVRHCVNPAHLEAVTQATNNRRAVAVRLLSLPPVEPTTEVTA